MRFVHRFVARIAGSREVGADGSGKNLAGGFWLQRGKSRRTTNMLLSRVSGAMLAEEPGARSEMRPAHSNQARRRAGPKDPKHRRRLGGAVRAAGPQCGTASNASWRQWRGGTSLPAGGTRRQPEPSIFWDIRRRACGAGDAALRNRLQAAQYPGPRRYCPNQRLAPGTRTEFAAQTRQFVAYHRCTRAVPVQRATGRPTKLDVHFWSACVESGHGDRHAL